MVPAEIADVAPWRDWNAAVDGALAFLYQRVGWDLWAVTRVDGDRQVVVRAQPVEPLRPGTAVSWESSFCRQMVSGNAPRVATVIAAVPAYANRATGPLPGVAAYLGVPLVTGDLELFGTLWGVAFRARPASAARELPLVEMVARMLSTLLAAESPSSSTTVRSKVRTGTR